MARNRRDDNQEAKSAAAVLQQWIDGPAAGSPGYLVKKISEPIEDVFKKTISAIQK